MEAEKSAHLFENETVYSEKLFRSVYAHHFFTRPLALVIWLLVLRWVVNILIMVIQFGWDGWMSLLPLAALLLIIPVLYIRTVNLAVKRELEAGGGVFPRRTFRIFEDRIHMRSSTGGEYLVPLSSVKSVRCTKSYIQINTEAKMILVLHRDGFTVGNFEECAGFLRSKKSRKR